MGSDMERTDACYRVHEVCACVVKVVYMMFEACHLRALASTSET
jgi:hypothetical protein